jgi:hypothetical protein
MQSNAQLRQFIKWTPMTWNWGNGVKLQEQWHTYTFCRASEPSYTHSHDGTSTSYSTAHAVLKASQLLTPYPSVMRIKHSWDSLYDDKSGALSQKPATPEERRRPKKTTNGDPRLTLGPDSTLFRRRDRIKNDKFEYDLAFNTFCSSISCFSTNI